MLHNVSSNRFVAVSIYLLYCVEDYLCINIESSAFYLLQGDHFIDSEVYAEYV